MTRLIDANALIETWGLQDCVKYGNETAEQQYHSYSSMMLYEIKDMIDDAPTIDAVEVVRCEDCKYMSMESGDFDGLEPACRFWTDEDSIYPAFVDMNGFCSEGKRKDGEEE